MSYCCGPGSTVGVATDYGLDGPGIESYPSLGESTCQLTKLCASGKWNNIFKKDKFDCRVSWRWFRREVSNIRLQGGQSYVWKCVELYHLSLPRCCVVRLYDTSSFLGHHALLIQTRPAATDVLKRGVENLEKLCDHTLTVFQDEVIRFKADNWRNQFFQGDSWQEVWYKYWIFYNKTNWKMKEKKIPVGARFFAHVQTGPGAHPASCTRGAGCFRVVYNIYIYAP
jgi:hypothetical protein